VRTEMPDITHDPDDFPNIRVRGTEVQALADWIFVGPETACHRLVDHHHLWRLLPISGRESAALQDWNFHRPEITRADRAGIRGKIISRRQGRTPFDLE